jgi:hypothetical protein
VWHPPWPRTLLIRLKMNPMRHPRDRFRLTRILAIGTIFVVCLGLLDGNGRAQGSNSSTNPQTQAQGKIVSNSELVVLPVTVRDRYGNLVGGLLQQDFRIFDDEVEQSIGVFSSEGTPLSRALRR